MPWGFRGFRISGFGVIGFRVQGFTRFVVSGSGLFLLGFRGLSRAVEAFGVVRLSPLRFFRVYVQLSL